MKWFPNMFGILLVISMQQAAIAADRPNVIFILVDDMGYGI